MDSIESFLPYPIFHVHIQRFCCSSCSNGNAAGYNEVEIYHLCPLHLLTRSSCCCAWWRWWPGPACWSSPSSGGWPPASSTLPLWPGILVGSPHCCPPCRCPHCTGLSWDTLLTYDRPNLGETLSHVLTLATTASQLQLETNVSFSWKLK